jgi:Flp pilus assembly protein TadG
MPSSFPTCALLAAPGPWLAFGGLLMVGILACVWVLARARRKAGKPAAPSLLARLQSENGSATVEFALVMPILMFLVMSLLQVGLLMVGLQFTQHAAFRAARAAIVQIPADTTTEPLNHIDPGVAGGKMDAIKAAAQYAVMPVCGELEGAGSTAGSTLAGGMQKYFSSYGADSPHWVNNLLAARMDYAIAKTKVTLLQASDGQGAVAIDFANLPEISGAFDYGPKDPVVVQVAHDMNLSVPYVRAMFSDGEQTTRAGQGAYATITTRAMLTNEGIDPTIRPAPFPRLEPADPAP